MLEAWHYPDAFRPAMVAASELERLDPRRLALEIKQDYGHIPRIGGLAPPTRQLWFSCSPARQLGFVADVGPTSATKPKLAGRQAGNPLC